MALWGKKNNPSHPTGPKEELTPWEHAKLAKKEEYERDMLSPGWYYYQDGYIWYGLKPNEDNTGLVRSNFHGNSPEELAQWLGVPVPPSTGPSKAELREEAERKARLTYEAQLHDQTAAAEQSQELNRQEPVPSEKEKRKRKSDGYVNEVKTRFTDGELARFRRRVQRSGLNQSEFMRRAALTGKIVIDEKDPVLVELLDELTLLRNELGRQGGMLKMLIKPNEGQRELAPGEWSDLMKAIRNLKDAQKCILELEEKYNGDH